VSLPFSVAHTLLQRAWDVHTNLYGGAHGLMRPRSCHLPSWQARERPGRRKPAAKMAARQICPKAQKIGRARSPLRAGVVCADQASGLNQVFRALTGAATLTCSAVAAVCDRRVRLSCICRTVLLHPCWEKRPAFAERRYKSCGTRAHHLGCSKRGVFEGKALSKPAAVRARAIPNFARRRSRQSMEPKAVLEHRAPKTSPPILHSRSAESR